MGRIIQRVINQTVPAEYPKLNVKGTLQLCISQFCLKVNDFSMRHKDSKEKRDKNLL